jgi:hypothetical protein
VTDAGGLPLVVLIGPANRRDEQLVPALLWLLWGTLSRVGLRLPSALQGDRGYGFVATIALVLAWGLRSLLAERGSGHGSGLGRRRWPVERTHSWFSRFRRLAQCYEREGSHSQGFHVLAACVICARRLRQARPPHRGAARAAA